MDKKTSLQSGSSLRKRGLALAALLLVGFSLSACIVAEPGYRGYRHHQSDWNSGGWQGGGNWQGNGDWNHHH